MPIYHSWIAEGFLMSVQVYDLYARGQQSYNLHTLTAELYLDSIQKGIRPVRAPTAAEQEAIFKMAQAGLDGWQDSSLDEAAQTSVGYIMDAIRADEGQGDGIEVQADPTASPPRAPTFLEFQMQMAENRSNYDSVDDVVRRAAARRRSLGGAAANDFAAPTTPNEYQRLYEPLGTPESVYDKIILKPESDAIDSEPPEGLNREAIDQLARETQEAVEQFDPEEG